MFELNQVVRLDAAGEITQVFGGEFSWSRSRLPRRPMPRATCSSVRDPIGAMRPAYSCMTPTVPTSAAGGRTVPGAGELGFPTGVLVDVDGNVYVGDAAGGPDFPGRPRIQKFHVEVSP